MDICDYGFNIGELANFIYVDGQICVRIVNVRYDKELNETEYFISAPKIDLEKAGCEFYKDIDTGFLKQKYDIGPNWDIGIACADELEPSDVGFIKLI